MYGLQALRAEVLANGLKKLNAAQVSKYPSNLTYSSVMIRTAAIVQL
jgi:hypothetical protein